MSVLKQQLGKVKTDGDPFIDSILLTLTLHDLRYPRQDLMIKSKTKWVVSSKDALKQQKCVCLREKNVGEKS